MAGDAVGIRERLRTLRTGEMFNMNTQFTTRRLLVNITVLCVALALIVGFPDAARSLARLLLVYAPALAVLGTACYLSHHRWTTFAVVGLGALLGWILSPRIPVCLSLPPSYWKLLVLDWESFGLFTAGGALAAAIIDWIAVTFVRRSRGQQQ